MLERRRIDRGGDDGFDLGTHGKMHGRARMYLHGILSTPNVVGLTVSFPTSHARTADI